MQSSDWLIVDLAFLRRAGESDHVWMISLHGPTEFRIQIDGA